MVEAQAICGLTSAVAGHRCRSGWQHVLVPLDLTRRSMRGLDHAVTLAMAIRARVSLLHVVVPDVHPLTMPVRQFQLPQVMADAQRKLARLQRALRRPGLAGEVRVCVGLPAEEIAAVAHELKADVLVMTTHGDTGLKHLLLGSISESVLRRAPCPVLIVRVGKKGTTNTPWKTSWRKKNDAFDLHHQR